MSVRLEASILDPSVNPDAGLPLLIATIRYGSNGVGTTIYFLSDEESDMFSIGRKLLGCKNVNRKRYYPYLLLILYYIARA